MKPRIIARMPEISMTLSKTMSSHVIGMGAQLLRTSGRRTAARNERIGTGLNPNSLAGTGSGKGLGYSAQWFNFVSFLSWGTDRHARCVYRPHGVPSPVLWPAFSAVSTTFFAGLLSFGGDLGNQADQRAHGLEREYRVGRFRAHGFGHHGALEAELLGLLQPRGRL